ncbi:MAG: beta-lactamase family protein [Clostridiales bacterium]|jgi:CubicO group peptidase (beta-lactamase class C family)|nr:beta-lactamase family protein [Clostridiales bacterium]
MELPVFEKFTDTVQRECLGVYGVTLYREGKGSVSHFFRDDNMVHLYSGSKTYASLAVGIAEGEGRLTLEDTVLDFFPYFKDTADGDAARLTVKHLLQMRAGYRQMLFTSDVSSHGYSSDWARGFFARERANPPGVAFFYDNGCTYLLGRIIEEVSGETLRDYLVPRLFAPLGIPNPQWHFCPRGHTLGAVGLCLKNEEFSRLGRLLLQGGIWDGRRLVTDGYVTRMARDLVDTGWDDPESARYGFQVWQCSLPGAFRADGKYGQFCVVLPERRAVVTITAHNEQCSNDILRAVWRDIAEGL